METEFVMREMMIGKFEEYLVERENSASTVEKYVRDVKTFFRFLGDVPAVSRKRLLEYKDWLLENYAVRSANSMPFPGLM